VLSRKKTLCAEEKNVRIRPNCATHVRILLGAAGSIDRSISIEETSDGHRGKFTCAWQAESISGKLNKFSKFYDRIEFNQLPVQIDFGRDIIYIEHVSFLGPADSVSV
jgi:hypothetical protein